MNPLGEHRLQGSRIATKAVTVWLAKQIDVQPITVPGRHGFYRTPIETDDVSESAVG